MRCNKCFKSISNTNSSGLCASCKSDPKITISTTNAKNMYGLTNEEIDNAKLFNFQIYVNGNMGSKYFIDDIEELAEYIHSCSDNSNNKRKNSYMKTIENTFDRISLKKKNRDMLSASIDQFLNENDIEPNDDLQEFVDALIQRNYDSDPNTITKYVKHKYKIDKLINDNLLHKFINTAKCCKEYNEYIFSDDKNRLSSELTFDKINTCINQKIILNSRKRYLNKFIKDNIDNEHHQYVKSLDIYHKYVSNSSYKITLDSMCKKLAKFIEHNVKSDDRKKAIDKYIKKNINDKYIGYVKSLEIYDKYINNPKLKNNFDSVCEIIFKEFKQKTKQDDRERIFKNGCTYFHYLKKATEIYKIGLLYNDYILNGGDVNAVTNTIKKEILGSDEINPSYISGLTKNLNIQHFVDTLSSNEISLNKNCDSEYYHKIKNDYLNGNIAYCKAINFIRSYVNLKKNILKITSEKKLWSILLNDDFQKYIIKKNFEISTKRINKMINKLN